uniref:Glucose-induced degradation protein 7 n=1 Tax=Lygus hesperus TaxID=30085 RepID=A0A0A9YKC1_LYGHE
MDDDTIDMEERLLGPTPAIAQRMVQLSLNSDSPVQAPRSLADFMEAARREYDAQFQSPSTSSSSHQQPGPSSPKKTTKPSDDVEEDQNVGSGQKITKNPHNNNNLTRKRYRGNNRMQAVIRITPAGVIEARQEPIQPHKRRRPWAQRNKPKPADRPRSKQ